MANEAKRWIERQKKREGSSGSGRGDSQGTSGGRKPATEGKSPYAGGGFGQGVGSSGRSRVTIDPGSGGSTGSGRSFPKQNKPSPKGRSKG